MSGGMAILSLAFLEGLSYTGARNLLLQEGYVEEAEFEEPDVSCGRKFRYPYVLYDSRKRKIDCIYYTEYCVPVMDVSYTDGRMTWEAVREEWTRN